MMNFEPFKKVGDIHYTPTTTLDHTIFTNSAHLLTPPRKVYAHFCDGWNYTDDESIKNPDGEYLRLDLIKTAFDKLVDSCKHGMWDSLSIQKKM